MNECHLFHKSLQRFPDQIPLSITSPFMDWILLGSSYIHPSWTLYQAKQLAISQRASLLHTSVLYMHRFQSLGCCLQPHLPGGTQVLMHLSLAFNRELSPTPISNLPNPHEGNDCSLAYFITFSCVNHYHKNIANAVVYSQVCLFVLYHGSRGAWAKPLSYLHCMVLRSNCMTLDKIFNLF